MTLFFRPRRLKDHEKLAFEELSIGDLGIAPWSFKRAVMLYYSCVKTVVIDLSVAFGGSIIGKQPLQLGLFLLGGTTDLSDSLSLSLFLGLSILHSRSLSLYISLSMSRYLCQVLLLSSSSPQSCSCSFSGCPFLYIYTFISLFPCLPVYLSLSLSLSLSPSLSISVSLSSFVSLSLSLSHCLSHCLTVSQIPTKDSDCKPEICDRDRMAIGHQIITALSAGCGYRSVCDRL